MCKHIAVENSVIIKSKRRFSSEEEMYKLSERYSTRTNNIARRVLGFKTPNEIVENYFKRVA